METEKKKKGIKDFSPLSHAHKQILHPDSNKLLPFCRRQEHFSTIHGTSPNSSPKRGYHLTLEDMLSRKIQVDAGLFEKDCTK